MLTPIEAHSPVKITKRSKNRTPGHVLSNYGLYLRAAAQCMLLFLVFHGFKFYRVTRSYSSHPFLCILEPKQSYLEVVHLAEVFARLNGIGSEINDYVSTAGTINSQRRLEASDVRGVAMS